MTNTFLSQNNTTEVFPSNHMINQVMWIILDNILAISDQRNTLCSLHNINLVPWTCIFNSTSSPWSGMWATFVSSHLELYRKIMSSSPCCNLIAWWYSRPYWPVLYCIMWLDPVMHGQVGNLLKILQYDREETSLNITSQEKKKKL